MPQVEINKLKTQNVCNTATCEEDTGGVFVPLIPIHRDPLVVDWDELEQQRIFLLP